MLNLSLYILSSIIILSLLDFYKRELENGKYKISIGIQRDNVPLIK